MACRRYPLRFPFYLLYDKILRCRPGIERLKLPESVSNSQYYVYRKLYNSQVVILKLPRFRNTCRFDLYECRHQIVKELADPIWIAHLPAVCGFRKNGSYEMEFVQGDNLLELYEHALTGRPFLRSAHDRVRLLQAIDDLLCNLRSYHERYGVLKGEWKHHNLIYDERDGVIKNVDIESLVSYEDIPWAHIDSAERNLQELKRVVAIAADTSV
jgi:cobalamin biosynthesis Co2+ chelatase CbiK